MEETGKGIASSSEIVEVEPVINEWTTETFVTSQVRSLRKGNSDYVTIVVDEDPGSTSRIEDEDHDKGNFALLCLCAITRCKGHHT
ncbi:unnamed protein product [Lathyrus oleraceus]|uniref:Uncharacterized protein n=1 Tax=Pisum sativum TaxID=3888 RepID=A0A9D4WVQ1_PEA|nr:hypothetical protein KIW84_055418 [Pisum sativum]